MKFELNLKSITRLLFTFILFLSSCRSQSLSTQVGTVQSTAEIGTPSSNEKEESRESKDEDKADEVDATLGPNHLIYEHHVEFNMSQGSAGMRMTIDVNGDVTYLPTHNAWAPVEYKEDVQDYPFFKYKGEGKVPINGTFKFWTDEDECTCSFQDQLSVKINGVNYVNPLEGYKINLKLNEKYYENPKWKCQCTKPELESAAKMNMEQMPAWKPPSFDNRTLEFIDHCYGQSVTEEFQGPIGEGYYKWTYENPSGYKLKSSYPLQYTQNAPQPTCRDHEGIWGPPLEDIIPTVAKWHSYEP